jgi:hypothetical protein
VPQAPVMGPFMSVACFRTWTSQHSITSGRELIHWRLQYVVSLFPCRRRFHRRFCPSVSFPLSILLLRLGLHWGFGHCFFAVSLLQFTLPCHRRVENMRFLHLV